MTLCNFEISINSSWIVVTLFPCFSWIVDLFCTGILSAASWVDLIDLLNHLVLALLFSNSKGFGVIFNAHPCLNSHLWLFSIHICLLSSSYILSFHTSFSLSNMYLINEFRQVLSCNSQSWMPILLMLVHWYSFWRFVCLNKIIFSLFVSLLVF